MFQRPPVPRTLDTRAQFLRDDHAEKLERCEHSMKLLERFVGGAVAKAVDEELRIENVLARCTGHGSGSGDVICTPSIDLVPSMSRRWKTTRSSARSIVSVAVAAPSARFAALSLDKGSRYVRETRCSRDEVRLLLVGVAIPFSVLTDTSIRQYAQNEVRPPLGRRGPCRPALAALGVATAWKPIRSSRTALPMPRFFDKSKRATTEL